MLIRELIVRHVGPQGVLHERGVRLKKAQLPPAILVHHDGDDALAPVAGDLVLVSAPGGAGLPERVDTELPLGATLALLFEVELTELPVDRVLAALAVANLQVVEAAVLSGTSTTTVAVVATRTKELIVPAPSLAHDLEPGDHSSPAVLRRLLGEHALEGLVQRARERVLEAQAVALDVRLTEVTAELKKLQADSKAREATLTRDLATARKEADAERKHMASLRSSTSFKVASRLARASGLARRIIPKPGPSKPRG